MECDSRARYINRSDQVEVFNNEIYTKAKHKYDRPPGEHLYSPDEAFVIYFVAKKIGSKMRELVVLPK